MLSATIMVQLESNLNLPGLISSLRSHREELRSLLTPNYSTPNELNVIGEERKRVTTRLAKLTEDIINGIVW
jgi:hypothetical protein